MAHLGIRHIAAYSPQARGRSERAFATLQDRLPKELALAGMTTVADANRFIAERYLPEHNAAFAIAPEQAGSAFVPDAAGQARAILCIQEERKVGHDNTVNGAALSADPTEPAAAALCARHREGSPISRRPPRGLPRSRMPGRLRSRGRLSRRVTAQLAA